MASSLSKTTVTLNRQISGQTNPDDPYSYYPAGTPYEEEFRNLTHVQKLNHQAAVMAKLNDALTKCQHKLDSLNEHRVTDGGRKTRGRKTRRKKTRRRKKRRKTKRRR